MRTRWRRGRKRTDGAGPGAPGEGRSFAPRRRGGKNDEPIPPRTPPLRGEDWHLQSRLLCSLLSSLLRDLMVRFHLYSRWVLVSFVAWCAVIEPAFDRWQWRPVASGEVTQTGSFELRGAIPGVASTPPGETHWSSWGGSDQKVGEWATGVFPAPHRLRLGVRGYPNLPGNHLRLEHVSTGAFLPLASHNPGESWEQMDVTVPRAWRGSGLRVVAKDGAVDWGGWLAVRQIEAARIPLPRLPPMLLRLGGTAGSDRPPGDACTGGASRRGATTPTPGAPCGPGCPRWGRDRVVHGVGSVPGGPLVRPHPCLDDVGSRMGDGDVSTAA